MPTGARVDLGSLPNQSFSRSAQDRIRQEAQIHNLIKGLERRCARGDSPDNLLASLGILTHGTQSKGAFLEEVTFFRARHISNSQSEA